MPSHIRKGDMVMVMAGNDRGATGEVLRILTKSGRVVVQGVNIRTKHLKPRQDRPQGGLLRVEMPIHMSNVLPLSDGKPTRVRFESRPDGTKARVAVRTGKELHLLHGPRARAARPAPAAAAAAPAPTRTRTTRRKAAAPAGAAGKAR
jgi:large subunit ribosomal protein L24